MAPRAHFGRANFDLPIIVAFLIFALIPFGPHFWFLIPFAVCASYNSAQKWTRVLPWLAFGFGIYLIRPRITSLTQLDLLSYPLLFIIGAVLIWCRRSKRNFFSVSLFPMLLGLISVLALCLTSLPHTSLAVWIRDQSQSIILPSFFHREAWTVPGESWSDLALDLYDSVLAPNFREGIMGWFAVTIGFSFFINGTMETMFRSFKTSQPQKRLKLWAGFNSWRAPDSTLFVLLGGLALLALEMTLGQRHFLEVRVLSWTLIICALFPIFCQGICFASFLIPRASFLPFVIIFALLIINPIPVLLLAGLVDLWFDLRSRMNSSREV